MDSSSEIKKIKIGDYSYELPNEKIAIVPLQNRDESKLLILKNKTIKEDKFCNLVEHISPDTLFIANNTRVIYARLLFRTLSQALVEIFCLQPSENIALEKAMLFKNNCRWKVSIGNLKRFKTDQLEIITEDNFQLVVKNKIELEDSWEVEFLWNRDITFAEVLEKLGHVPIPPYIKRADNLEDKTNYQTMFATIQGSVAAPTASLHFTESLKNKILLHGHQFSYLTLHVGAGTFKPVKSEFIGEHFMHAEEITVSINFLEEIKNHSNNIVAIGTTSMRALESIYYLGIDLLKNYEIASNQLLNGNYVIDQWAPYHVADQYSTNEVIESVEFFLKQNSLASVTFKSCIMLTPGYKFKFAQGMITNFHQPNSTLLLLVSAFIGDEWKNVYNYALQNNFRFLSYGDACLFLNERSNDKFKFHQTMK